MRAAILKRPIGMASALACAMLLLVCAGCQINAPAPFRIDLSRIDRDADGNVRMLRGQGIPGTPIEVRDGEKLIARTSVSEEGIWEVEKTFEPGTYQINIVELDADNQSLRTHGPTSLVIGGGVPTPKKDTVAEAEEPEKPAEPALPSKTYQMVKPAPRSEVAAGSTKISGKAPGGAVFMIYVNDQYSGRGRANRLGQWQVFVNLKPGQARIALLPKTRGERGDVLNLTVK